jgi:tryptophan synthase alpha chain
MNTDHGHAATPGASGTGNRLRRRLLELRAEGRGALVPFVVLGDPDIETSDALIQALVRGGADALELGLPFSDPPADGPVIQAADVRALQAGVRVDDCFELLRRHAQRSDVPVSLLVYWNLVLQRGVDRFYADCAAAGVDAVLVADLPLQEADEALLAARKHGVAPVLLATPLSSDARLRAIAAVADGYLYVTARIGVTGAVSGIDAGLKAELARIAALTDLPLLCGFGIGGPAEVAAVLAAGAHGAIVGSALVRHIESNLGDRARMLGAVEDFVRCLSEATGRDATTTTPKKEGQSC